MKKTFEHLYQNFIRITPYAMSSIILLCGAANAAVVQRGTTSTTSTTSSANRVSASRANNTASRMPTMTLRAQTATSTTETADTQTTEEPVADTTVTTAEVEESVIIENKSSQFDSILSTTSTSGSDTAAESLAEQIRRQRAALDAQDASTTATTSMQNALASGKNACDSGLRTCMQSKCGSDFSKCKGDTDTTWGTKMDSCRRDLSCSGEEYRLFAAEIKSDRDMNAKLSLYNSIIDCGNQYNDCIVTQCGTTYSKCLGKTAGDAAISACETIAKNCTQQDSGLASRTMNVFGTLRQDAEVQVQKDEQRLYDLRDQMAAVCSRLGAMFDERSLDCVYTVNFYAGDNNTLYASKKAYAGSTFDCNQNWFGVDITTFKENAYRLTREQKSATSAMLGAGLGVATGAITSGAIDRAIDRSKADKALKKAEAEHEENYGTDKSDTADKNASADKKPDETKKEEATPTKDTPAPAAEKTETPKAAADGDSNKPAGDTTGGGESGGGESSGGESGAASAGGDSGGATAE